MPSGATMQSRCQKVSRYIEDYNDSLTKFWVLLAQNNPWPDENEPPIFHTNLVEIPQPIGFVFVHSVNAVFENSDGPIVLPTTAFQPVTDLSPNVMAISKAHFLHVEATVSQTNLLPLASTYRTIGLCTSVVFKNGFVPDLTAGTIVNPSNVDSYFLDWVSTQKQISVSDQDSHTFRIIRVF